MKKFIVLFILALMSTINAIGGDKPPVPTPTQGQLSNGMANLFAVLFPVVVIILIAWFLLRVVTSKKKSSSP